MVNRREGRKEGERKGLIKGEQKEISRALSFLKELCKDEKYSQKKTEKILKNYRSFRKEEFLKGEKIDG